MSADSVSTWAGSGGSGAGVGGSGVLGGGSVLMEGVGGQVEISVVVGVELDAVSCLLFDFKGGGPESGCKKDVLEPVTAGKREKLKEVPHNSLFLSKSSKVGTHVFSLLYFKIFHFRQFWTQGKLLFTKSV